MVGIQKAGSKIQGKKSTTVKVRETFQLNVHNVMQCSHYKWIVSCKIT